LNYYAGNVRGTDQYWAGKRNEFKATAQYHSHVNNQEVRAFHTGSMAEYHDPFLRRVLGKYVAKVESEAAGVAVVENDTDFHKAVSNYKQVVTHYFACKTETLMAIFLAPVIGLTDIMLRYEFSKSRGAIHFHGFGFTK
jgi:hypothetical protein